MGDSLIILADTWPLDWTIDPTALQCFTQPTSNTKKSSSIVYLHAYARLYGRYPKLGLFCSDDLEFESVTTVGESDAGMEDEFSLTHPKTCDDALPSDQDESKEIVDPLELEDLNTTSEKDTASQLSGQRAMFPIAAEHVEARAYHETTPRTRNASGFPGIFEREEQSRSVRAPSNAKKRKHFSLEDSADETVGDDAVFSGHDSDGEYIPGANLRAKCTTKIGRQESKSSRNDRRTNPTAKGFDSALRATTKYPSRQRPARSKIDNPTMEGSNARPEAIPATSGRGAKKRKLIEDYTDRAVDDRFGNYPGHNVEDGSSSRTRYGPAPKVGGKILLHDTTPLETTLSLSNKRHSVDATDESSADDVTSMRSSPFEVSEEEYIPGHHIIDQFVRRMKTRMKKSMKEGAKGGTSTATRATTHSPNKTGWPGQQFADIKGDLPRGAGSTRRESKIQATEEGRVLTDLPNAVRESRGSLRYRCLACGRRTKSRGDMERHLQSAQHRAKSCVCPECLSTFTREDSLKRHMKNRHKGNID